LLVTDAGEDGSKAGEQQLQDVEGGEKA